MVLEFPCGRAVLGSGIVTVAAQVTDVAQVWSLAWKLPHAMGLARKPNQNKCSGVKKQNDTNFKDIIQWSMINDSMISESNSI